MMAQPNLIPNPDFEEYFDCDYDLYQQDLNTVISDWARRGKRAARYFNLDCVDDPVSDYYQSTNIISPQHGNGFLVQNHFYAPGFPLAERMEYSQVQLLSPIEKDKRYFLRYYTTPAFPGSPQISHLGVLLSDNFIVEPPPDITLPSPVIVLDPQLEVDTLMTGAAGEWNKVTHCFTADSNYTVITIGIFADPNEVMSSLPILSAGATGAFTAYDNFYLTEIDPNLTYETLGGTDTICAGECLTLTTNHSLIDGVWEWDLPGSDLGSSTDSVVTVCYGTPGTYDVNIWVEHCIGEYENHFPQAITVLENINYQPAWTDTVVCPGTPVAVDLTGAGYPVTWSDGSAEAYRLFTQAGSYAYTLSNGFCERTYSFSLAYTHPVQYEALMEMDCPGGSFTFLGQEYDSPGIYGDTLLDVQGCDSVIYEIGYSYFVPQPIAINAPLGFCEGGSAVLEITSGHTDLVWGNGGIGNNTTVGSGGTYTVTGQDANGCEVDAAITVEEWPVPTVSTENLLDTFFRVGMPLPVSYSGSINMYGWEPAGPLDCGGCPFPLLQEPQGGSYEVTVSNVYGCTATGIVRISFKDSDVYVPNAIRNEPNVYVNGLLFAQGNNDFTYSLKVFDRWGGLRYEADGLRANDPTQGWRPAGEVVTGVYTWMILFEENGRKRVLAGDVTVL